MTATAPKTSDFLEAVLPEPEATERIELRAKAADGHVVQRFARSVAELITAAKPLRDTSDVWFGPTLRDGEHGDGAHVTRVGSVWIDVDANHFSAEKPAALAVLRGLPVPPSMVVHTGHGYHAYWLLDEPHDRADERRLRRTMRGINAAISAEALTPLDKVDDLPRVLRLPGTFNRKEATPLAVSVIQFEPGRRYDLSELAGAYWVDEPEQQFAQPVPERVGPGDRHRTLMSLAGTMRYRGMTEAAILAALQVENATWCDPPLPDDAVIGVARSAGKYEPAITFSRNGHSDQPAPLPADRGQKWTSHLNGLAIGGSSVTVLTEATGSELAAAGPAGGALPSLPFLGRDGYLVEGWSHLIAGYPRCGKTELAVRLVAEWLATGRHVVYLTEEPRSIREARLSPLTVGPGEVTSNGTDPIVGPSLFAGLNVVFALGVAPEALLDRAFGGDEQIVIVDTIRSLIGIRDETDNSEITRVVNVWIAAQRAAGKTLILLHHNRKGGGENGEGIAGGHALLGVCDMALEVVRLPKQGRRRRVVPYGRVLSPAELVYEMDDAGQMVALGEPSALALAGVKERLLAVLDADWWKAKEIVEALGEPKPSEEQVRNALLELVKSGQIVRDPPLGDGARGKTHRWRVASEDRP